MAETGYVRNDTGLCEELPIDEAIHRWLDPDGYRLTISIGSYELILRRESGPHGDSFLGEPMVEHTQVIVRPKVVREGE